MRVKRIVLGLLVAVAAAGSPGPATAVDGVIEINQARALAGGVTPGDGAGFPVTISASGSYRLTGNLTVPAGVDAIDIDPSAHHVTLDLNRFEIAGPKAMDPSYTAGVFVLGGAWLRVRDGTILGFLRGIDGNGSATSVDSVHVEGAGDDGIRGGNLSVISDSTAVGNAAAGINVGAGSAVRDCTVNNNSGAGIWSGHSSLVTGNAVIDNRKNGIIVLDGSRVIGNDVNLNGNASVSYAAIAASAATTVSDNTIFNNHYGLGIYFSGTENGYARNVLSNNNGGSANPQVGGSATDLGGNLCGTHVCP